MIDDLNDDTVLIYAIKHYDNYIKSEFTEDYRVFKYIKRLLQRYRTSGELRETLLLNHINVVYNMFGVEAGTRLLFFKLDDKDYSSLKTFLLFLNTMPDVVYGINGKNIRSSDIAVDIGIAKTLRSL